MSDPYGPTLPPVGYSGIHWGYGPGLLVCDRCGAVVLPEPESTIDKHAVWHRRIGDEDA